MPSCKGGFICSESQEQPPLAFAALCKNTTLIIHMCMWQEELLREYKGHKWKHNIILVVPHCQAHVCLFKILMILYGLYLHIWYFTMFKFILQIPLHNQIKSQPVHQMMLSAIIYGINLGQYELHVMGKAQMYVVLQVMDNEILDTTRMMVYITNKVRYITTYWFYSELLCCMCIKIKYLHTWHLGSLFNIPCPLQKVLWKFYGFIILAIVN